MTYVQTNVKGYVHGRRHEFSTGETGGGRIQVSQNRLPRNSDFFSDIAHFILKILENPKKIAKKKSENFLKKRDFWGTSLPEFRNGGTRPPHPPVAPRMGMCHQLDLFFIQNATSSRSGGYDLRFKHNQGKDSQMKVM